jgi:hypothetical protein
MAKMAKEIVEILGELTANKVMATCDAAGNLNVVPIGSLTAMDDETLLFADLFGKATRTMKNIEATKKVAVAVFKVTTAPPFAAYQIKGTFQGFQTSGPLFEKMFSELKEATAMEIKAVGTIKVDAAYSCSPLEAGARKQAR